MHVSVTKDKDSVVRSTETERGEIEELASRLGRSGDGGKAYMVVGGKRIPVPRSVYESLLRAVEALAEGSGVMVAPVDAELTTGEAAELLNVSRPYLIRLLEEKGEMPFHRSGTHRRIRLRDALDYKKRRDEQRRRLLGEMSRDAQRLGLYDPPSGTGGERAS